MSKSLYLITDGNALKIGISDHPSKRLKQLQTGHPKPLKLLFSIETEKARSIEAHLHKILSHSRSYHAREWFVLGTIDWLIPYIKSLVETVK